MDAILIASAGSAFVAGLFGSLHCIGMCGPLVSLGCRSGLTRGSLWGPWIYAFGKLFSYSILGLAAGWIGSAFITNADLERAAAFVSIGGGILMIALLALSRLRIAAQVGGPSAAFAKFSLRTGQAAPLWLGIGSALLPCGLLYAMVARSAAAANPVAGMVLMQAFGIGTSPALIGVGTLVRVIPQRWNRFGAIAGEIVLALTAVVLIWRGIIGLTAAATGHACCH